MLGRTPRGDTRTPKDGAVGLRKRLVALLFAACAPQAWFSAFYKACGVMVVTWIVKVLLLSWQIATYPYLLFIAGAAMDCVAYRMLARRGIRAKKKFRVCDGWYWWSVSATLVLDLFCLVMSAQWLRAADIPRKWWHWVPWAHVQHTALSILSLNLNVYSSLNKRNRVKFIFQVRGAKGREAVQKADSEERRRAPEPGGPGGGGRSGTGCAAAVAEGFAAEGVEWRQVGLAVTNAVGRGISNGRFGCGGGGGFPMSPFNNSLPSPPPGSRPPPRPELIGPKPKFSPGLRPINPFLWRLWRQFV